ncbi:MAG: DUF3365 domain-containing protein [Nitrospirota bacterium]|nr:DUF3365 domain-containing protein [Nitrospirota bacterium]MDE3119980.1 DUF3365 domain-containing protein [Nitrospirota bacterium]MDE3241588.1 DUF3365 domain-containing protein [Nitrospirota bacterium]
MSCWARITGSVALALATLTLAVSTGLAEDNYDLVARYVLETVRAFRTAYVLNVVEHVREGGIIPKEDWIKDAHAIPLPAQFVKAAGADLESFEIGLIGLTPVYKSNLPRTQAEIDALQRLTSDRSQKVISFVDGNQFKAMAADIAVVQSCVDCHNIHPDSPWRNYKKGDIMGAVIVRLNKHGK